METTVTMLNSHLVIEARAVIQHIIATEKFFECKDLMEIDFEAQKRKNLMPMIQLAMCIEHKLGVSINQEEIGRWSKGSDVIDTYIKYAK
jgi:hypothetical protein